MVVHPSSSLPTNPPSSRQIKYSELISGLQRENVRVNRRMLSELAANEPYSFRALVDQVRFMRGGAAVAVVWRRRRRRSDWAEDTLAAQARGAATRRCWRERTDNADNCASSKSACAP